jgi:type IV pilus assembly protein PilQ
VSEPQAPDPLASPPKKLDIDFHAIELTSALRALAQQAGVNLVLTESVKGTVSLQLRGSDAARAIEALAQARGLVLNPRDQVWWIGTAAEWVTLEKSRQEVKALQITSADLVQRTYRLHHARAVDWLDQLLGRSLTPGMSTTVASNATGAASAAIRAGGSSARWLSPRGQALADSRTNQLVVLDTPEVQDRVTQWIEQLDVPQRQVQIEARIVEASEGFSRSLGSKFQNASGTAALDLTAVGLSGFSPGKASLTLLGPTQSRQISVEISALEERGLGKLIATPSLVTADQARAVIEQGTELPYQAGSNASNTHTVAFRKAALVLDVLPQITPKDEIHLVLDLQRDSVGSLTADGYAIDTKRLQTQVRVPDGGTLIIGGIYIDDHHDQQHHVPGWGDIPILKWLFGQSQQIHQRQELMIFITPKILTVEAPAADAP